MPGLKITIRPATARDLPAIRRLIRMYPRQIMQSPLPKAREFFVALQNHQVIGCCALEIYSKRLAEIRSLAVRKDFQGQGIAKKLIRRCLKRARQEGIYEVLSITAALKLFKKFGFQTFHQEKYALLKVL